MRVCLVKARLSKPTINAPTTRKARKKKSVLGRSICLTTLSNNKTLN